MNSKDLVICPLILGEVDGSTMLDTLWSLCTEPRPVRIPILAFLIKGEECPIIVDTGFRYTEHGETLATSRPHRIKAEWDLAEQIKNQGVKPEDIKYVVLTHLHYDHCGNCNIFPNAKLIIQRAELQEAAAPLTTQASDIVLRTLFYDRKDIATIVNDLWDQIVLIDGDEEIIPGVKCVLFKNSHTPGSQAVYVETKKGTAILLGDIARNVELNIKAAVPPGLYYDLRSMQAALAKIRKDGKVFYPGHDYSVFDNLD